MTYHMPLWMWWGLNVGLRDFHLYYTVCTLLLPGPSVFHKHILFVFQEKVGYRVSKEDFQYVEKLIPMGCIPEPPECTSYPTPSGWYPQRGQCTKYQRYRNALFKWKTHNTVITKRFLNHWPTDKFYKPTV